MSESKKMKASQALITKALDQLEEVSHDVSQDDILNLLRNEDKVCFVTCNSYKKPKYSLGVAPINDAITVAKFHKSLGYYCIHLHNPSPRLFLRTFDKVMQLKLSYLTIFFGGHGGNASNESMILFDTGYIKSSILISHIKKYSHKETLKLFISDCCGAGSVWCSDHLPPNTISICSSQGVKPSKQADVCGKPQGLFTYFFWKNVGKFRKKPLESIIRATNRYLSKFDQEMKCEANPESFKNRIFLDELIDIKEKYQN